MNDQRDNPEDVQVSVAEVHRVHISCPGNTQLADASSRELGGYQLRPTLIYVEWTRGNEHPHVTFRGPRILKSGIPGRPITGIVYPGDPIPAWMSDLFEPHAPEWAGEV